MNSNTFNRISGVSLIISVLLTIGTFFNLTPAGELTSTGFILDVFKYIFLVPAFFALYLLYKAVAASSSLAAIVVGLVGIVAYSIFNPLIPAWSSATGLMGILGLALPILLFGVSAYRHPQLGMSRVLGIIGILTGILGLVNVGTILASGGNWQSPNNPALASVINISYAGMILLSLVWSVWTGIVLFSQKKN